MVLKPTEQWTANSGMTAEANTGTMSSSPGSPGEVGEVMKILEGLRKRKHSATTESKYLKVGLGWMHWSFKENKYKQVRSSKGEKSATETLTVTSGCTYEDILKKAMAVYFPKGKSKKGRKENMTMNLGTVKGVMLEKNGFSVQSYIQSCKTQKCRLYLLSKPMAVTVDDMLTSPSSTSSDELPDIEVRVKRLCPRQGQPSAPQTIPCPGQSSEQPSALHTIPCPGQSSEQPSALHTIPCPKPALRTETVHQDMDDMDFFREIDTPTVSFRLPDDNSVCPICYDRRKDTVMIPCGHPFCHPCAVQVFENVNPCPLCRETVDKISCVNG